MSTVHFVRLSQTRRRHRPNRPTTTDWAYVLAEVDGHVVKARAGRAWACSCGEPECDHPDIVANLIHPTLLNQIEGEAKHHD